MKKAILILLISVAVPTFADTVASDTKTEALVPNIEICNNGGKCWKDGTFSPPATTAPKVITASVKNFLDGTTDKVPMSSSGVVAQSGKPTSAVTLAKSTP